MEPVNQRDDGPDGERDEAAHSKQSITRDLDFGNEEENPKIISSTPA